MKCAAGCLSGMIEHRVCYKLWKREWRGWRIFSFSDDYKTENKFTKEGNIEEPENDQWILEL